MREWVIAQLKEHKYVDVLNAAFVESFIRAFDPDWTPTMWGAHKCPALGRLLANMARDGVLKRFASGLGPNWQPGFPRWVYVYSLKD